LIKRRWFSSCGLLRDKDGQPVITIVGGADEGGMEMWNPLTSEMKMLWSKNPILAENCDDSAELLPIDRGNGFILYGGIKGIYSSDEIWKFSQ